jgi:Uma2 family endonuclease
MATVEDHLDTISPPIPSVWENGITLQGVSWDTYVQFVDGLEERRMFVTYDHGTMEIQTMSPSRRHENPLGLIQRLVGAISLLRGIPIESGGSTTHRRADLAKGVEPDACYWVKNEARVRGVMDLDLSKYPPPDLAIEIGIHASAINRMSIFAKMGVSEIWHIDGLKLQFLLLDRTKKYRSIQTSRVFPMVQRQAVAEAISALRKVGETEALNQLLAALKLR